jgi:hypothetical protein
MRISQSFRFGPIRLGASRAVSRRGKVRVFASIGDGPHGARLGVSAPVGGRRKRAAR